MERFESVFLTKAGHKHILTNRRIYRFKEFKIGLLIKLHLLDKKNSKLNERGNILEYFRQEFRGKLPNEVTTDSLSLWLNNLRLTQCYSEKTMSHIKCQINVFFKWLVTEGAYKVNPLEKIKFKQNRPPVKPRRVFDSSEIKKIIYKSKELSPTISYPFLYTLIHTGARRSEVLNLKLEDINFKKRRLTFKNTKNGEDRTIMISKDLVDLLKKQNTSDEGHVFTSINGVKLSRQRIQKHFNELKAHFPHFGDNWACHSMRHSFAYNFLKGGGEMYQLQAILGHKSIKMTVDLYGNLKSEDIENPSPYDF